MAHQDHFDLDIPIAIHDQLVGAFGVLRPIPLSEWDRLAAPAALGVYGLYYNGALVYVGKADRLEKRLGEHQAKVAGRQGISPDVVGATFLTVNPNWSAYAPETILIRHYKPLGLCEWNGGGFGNHDVGRRRDTSAPNDFDRMFPIRLDWACTSLSAGRHVVADVLASVKAELPFLLRYSRKRSATRALEGATIVLDAPAPTIRDLMTLVSEEMSGWQATALLSHIIFYPESRSYEDAGGIVL